MTLSYAHNAACARAARNTASRAVFDRKIGDLILKLDLVADHIPPDHLGGANEAHAAIDELVDVLEGLRRM
ncbi:hypothetical protein Q3C01_41210 [Bradyrhizobium sp. UFLA05-109]